MTGGELLTVVLIALIIWTWRISVSRGGDR
jgi:hypothetical protein